MRVRVLESLTNSMERLQFLEVQLKMGLASVDHWEIVDGFEATLPSKANPKMKKAYQRHVKKTMSIIAFNLEDNQLAHIGVIKDMQGMEDPLQHPQNVEFVAHSLHARYIRFVEVGVEISLMHCMNL